MKFFYKLPVLLVMLCPVALRAEIVGGDIAMPFLGMGRSAVYYGMGGASLASSTSAASAVFSNPSTVPFFPGKMDIAVSYISWMPETDRLPNGNAGVSLRIGERVGVTIGGAGMNYDLPVVTETGLIQDGEKGRNLVCGAGLGIRIVDGLSLGANVKFASQKVTGSKTDALVFDFMAAYRTGGFTATAGIRNFGSDVKDVSSVRYNLPSSAAAGLGYKSEVAPSHSVEALIDADCLLSGGGGSVAAGGSYTYAGIVSVRAGYRLASDKAVVPSFASAGIGLKYSGISLDAAFIFGSEVLRNSFSVGIGISF